MTDDIQLISDGESLAVIGDSTAVEAFLAAEAAPVSISRSVLCAPLLSNSHADLIVSAPDAGLLTESLAQCWQFRRPVSSISP